MISAMSPDSSMLLAPFRWPNMLRPLGEAAKNLGSQMLLELVFGSRIFGSTTLQVTQSQEGSYQAAHD